MTDAGLGVLLADEVEQSYFGSNQRHRSFGDVFQSPRLVRGFDLNQLLGQLRQRSLLLQLKKKEPELEREQKVANTSRKRRHFRAEAKCVELQ